MTTSTAKINAAYQTDSFGTAGTAKVTWTPTAGTNWTAETACTDCVNFVDKVGVFLWGSAADKTGEDPYKTMNTWYTTNKAALDSASIASSAQVGPWGLYLDLQVNAATSAMYAYPSTDTATIASAAAVCASNGALSTGFKSGYLGFPAIGTIGSSFGVGIKNKTSSASSPFLLWGVRVTSLATAAVAGTAVNEWESYDWTPSASITNYGAAIDATLQATLSGVNSAAGAQTTWSATMGTAPFTTMRTCDTTKWASSTACNGVTKWATNTGTAYTSSTAKGSKRAWIWLADANPTSKSSVFGVEKDDELEITLHQRNMYKGAAVGSEAACVLPTTANTDKQTRHNIWGVAYYKHTGASATLLGASAVMAALVSFF